MSGIHPEPYFHSTNGPLINGKFWCISRAFQNLVSEHSIEGDPASLYNLTKSDPDPLYDNPGIDLKHCCIPVIVEEN